MNRWSAVAALVVLIAGCGTEKVEDRVTMVDGDDPAMNAAIDKGRETVQTFIDALKAPKPGQDSFAIKKKCVDGDQVEYMWLNPVRFDGTRFQGTINNDAELVKNVKIGDKATVAPAEICDWMFIDHGKLVGGYTLRVLRDNMPPSEREEFDKSLPFTID